MDGPSKCVDISSWGNRPPAVISAQAYLSSPEQPCLEVNTHGYIEPW